MLQYQSTSTPLPPRGKRARTSTSFPPPPPLLNLIYILPALLLCILFLLIILLLIVRLQHHDQILFQGKQFRGFQFIFEVVCFASVSVTYLNNALSLLIFPTPVQNIFMREEYSLPTIESSKMIVVLAEAKLNPIFLVQLVSFQFALLIRPLRLIYVRRLSVSPRKCPILQSCFLAKKLFLP